MSYVYAVVGAGRQGVAAAYDLARSGDAEKVIMADLSLSAARKAADRVNGLLDTKIVRPIRVDAARKSELKGALKEVDSIVSGLPYEFNLTLTEVAVGIGASMCDMGGNTALVRKQLKYDALAKKANVTIVPDCGMGPGMNVSLAVYAMSLVDRPREVYIWDGGLPQNPIPPWNYKLTFNVGGLTNEYDGNAYFLRDGKVTEVPCFEGFEEIDFPQPLGRLEAAVTSGGLSMAPWTFEGKLKRLENKTLRYPGHWTQFRAFAQLGLLELQPIRIGSVRVAPRSVFHALLEPRIVEPQIRDIGIIRVKCLGEKNGRPAEAVVELTDYYDENTGFTAMQRLTGWHTSIFAILAAQGKIRRGAVSVELAVTGPTVVQEARKRGFDIKERLTLL